MPANTSRQAAFSFSRDVGIGVVVLAYVLFASLWLLLSDRLVRLLFYDPVQILVASLFKDWLFVALAALLLYGLMRRWVGGEAGVKGPLAGSLQLRWPLLLLAAVIVTLTSAAILNTAVDQKATETARLGAIAGLKTRQVADWLRERQGDADFIRTSESFAELYRHWQEGDAQSGERLQGQLGQLGKYRGFAAISLLNPAGDPLWGTAEVAPVVSPPLQAAIDLAKTERRVRRVGPYRDANGNMRLGFVVPLAALPGPSPLVAFHIDLADWLFPSLQAWPVPSQTGETVLFRRAGEQVLFLNELRHLKNSAANLHFPLTTKKLLSAQVLRGEVVPGELVEGVDYRGVACLGVVRPVAGTDWFLLAKMDESEMYAEVAGNATWIGFVGLLVLFVAGASLHLLRQRQQLAVAASVQQSQEERLYALRLLAAIADCSDDAIFSKDLQGRYTLFNRAASRFVGKPVEAVLGQDDSALFPPEQAEKVMAFGRRVIAENRILTSEEALDTVDGLRVFQGVKGPLRDEQGRVIGIFGISRDITQHKQAERAALESEGRFRALLEQSLAGIYIIQEGRFLYVSPAFAALFGYDSPQALTERAADGFDALQALVEHLTIADCHDAEAPLAEGPPGCAHYVFAGMRRDGSRVDIEVQGSACCYQGQPAVIGLVVDITERKQAEDALRVRERYQRAVLDNFPFMVWLKDTDSRFLAVNKAFAEVANVAGPDELVGKTDVDCWTPELAGYYRADDRAVLESGQPKIVEEEVAQASRRFWVETYKSPVEMDGRVIGTVGFARDISERKQAEAALQASEKRFRDIVGVSADWIWEVDAQARYTYASESVLASLGYTPAEILGKTPFDFMPADEAQRLAALFADISARRVPFRELDNINRHKDGSLRYVQTNGVPILDGEGRLLGYRGLDRDVTQARQSELALREREERLRVLFTRSNDAIMTIEPPDWRFTRCNLATLALFGVDSEQEFTTFAPYDLSPATQPDGVSSSVAARRWIELALAQGRVFFEWTHQRVNGECFPASVLLTAMTINGQQVIQATVRDISAQKAAEQALLQHAAELQRFNRAMVGREIDMIALKQQVNELSRQLGMEPPYPLAFLNGYSTPQEDGAK